MMQTKKLCVLLLLLLATVSLQAQVKVGVTAGLNISQLHVSDGSYKYYTDKIRPGFLVGPTVVCNIPKTGLGFDLSALFDLRGAKSKNHSNLKTINCYSFQFPLHVRYGVNVGDMVHAFLFTGPQFGLSVGDRERLLETGTGKNTGHPMERRFVSKSSWLSWNLGVGAVVLENLQVRISYNLALKKSAELQQVDLTDGSVRSLADVKANACQVSFSYLF